MHFESVLGAVLLCVAMGFWESGYGQENGAGAGVGFRVTDFGAVGDGEVDDTGAIQRAVDAARGNGGGIVVFPAGRYLVGTVHLTEGLTLNGYGATILKKAMAGKWGRTFTTQRERYRGDVDSRPLVIRGFVVDGNRAVQGPYEKYELEQQHMIFLVGDPVGKGRLRAIVEDCVFQEGVADGLSIYTNVSVKVRGCSAKNVFRGGVVVTGGHTEVQVSDFTAGGEVHATGIDVEIDGAGYGKSYRVEMTVDGMVLDGDFDVGIRDGSTFLGTNIVSRSGPFYVHATDSTVSISNSSFGVGEFSSYGNRVVFPKDVTFRGCHFAVHEPAGEEADRRFAAMHVYWNISGTAHEDQRLRLIDCVFGVGADVEDSDTTYAVYAEADPKSRNNVLVVRGGEIGRGYDYGIYLNQGGRVRMTDVELDSATGIHLGSSAKYGLDVTLAGVRFGEHVETTEFLVGGQAENVIAHQNVFISEMRNVLGTGSGLGKNTYRGGRTVVGKGPPKDVPGLLGDVYRLAEPAEGKLFEWVCTRSDAKAGTWVPAGRLGKD